MFLKSLNPIRRIRKLVQELRRAREEAERARRRIAQLERETQRLEEKTRGYARTLKPRNVPPDARLLRFPAGSRGVSPNGRRVNVVRLMARITNALSRIM